MTSIKRSDLLRAGLVAGSLPAPATAELGTHSHTLEHRSQLLTLLFTDIVGSTATLERIGDLAWCELLMRHHAVVREHLPIYDGQEVETTGDGFFATFARPSQAVRFAVAVTLALSEMNVQIRTGIHAGECEISGKHVVGVAVHVASRVASFASQGEVLVSNTVKDLLAGSNLHFCSRDWQCLKGLSERRELFALDDVQDLMQSAVINSDQ